MLMVTKSLVGVCSPGLLRPELSLEVAQDGSDREEECKKAEELKRMCMGVNGSEGKVWGSYRRVKEGEGSTKMSRSEGICTGMGEGVGKV